MGVVDGQAVSAAVTNPAFIDANQDDSTIGKLDLNNPDSASGPFVVNLQREVNSNNSFSGRSSGSAYNVKPSWTHNEIGSSTDDLFIRTNAITGKFNGTTGHTHDGTDGNGPNLSGSAISGNPLHGYILQGTTLTGVTGTSTDVSTQMTGFTASAGSTSQGAVVTAPNNKVFIRDSNDDEYKDGSGNAVYGRLTFAASVWTLSYYTEVSGVETVYTFSSSTVKWYFQHLYNPLTNAPIYSELAYIPSANATADVITATTSLQGKTQLATASQDVSGSASSAGTANATVANADHTHRGVASFAKSGSSALYGAVTVSATNGVTATQTSQNIDFNADYGASATSVTSANAGGSATTLSRSDHAHQGVHSVAKSGSTALFSDVTFTGTTNITLTQVSQNIDISFSGTLPVTSGGTGLTTITAHSIIIGNGTSNPTLLSPGTTAYALVSNGASADPSYQQVSLTAGVTGTLPIGNGGTGQTTATNAFNALSPLTTKGDLLTWFTSSNQRLGVGSDGQVLTADSTQTAGIKWATPSSSGGGGGGSLFWIEDESSPLVAQNAFVRYYQFDAGLTQNLYCLIKVPNSYTAGSQIKLRGSFYCDNSVGTALIQSVSTLIRLATDAFNSTTNQRTSTNSAFTMGAGSVNKLQSVLFDLTDASGQINGVAVSANDDIIVKMTRGSDSSAGSIFVPVYGFETSFT